MQGVSAACVVPLFLCECMPTNVMYLAHRVPLSVTGECVCSKCFFTRGGYPLSATGEVDHSYVWGQNTQQVKAKKEHYFNPPPPVHLLGDNSTPTQKRAFYK